MKKILLVGVNSKYIHLAYGLYSLAAYARSKMPTTMPNIDIRVLEPTIQTPILTALSDIYSQQPDIVGLSVHIWNRDYVLTLAGLVKKVLPSVKLILGGPEVSFTAKNTLLKYPYIDYIISGEGEIVFSELLEKLSLNLPVHNIAGLSGYLLNREIFVNTELQTVTDLDSLLLSDDYIAEGKNKVVYYESSRGCPFNCSYCLSGLDRSIRHKSLPKIFAELDKLITANVRQVKFVDRTFNLDAKHYLSIMKFLAVRKTNINFHFEIKADLLTNEDLDFLATVPAGLFQFEIGVQSTHPETLRAINRQENFDKLTENIRRLKSFSNIKLHLDLICGLPYETILEFKKSFQDVYSLAPDMLQMGFLKILPGSEIEQQVTEFDYQYMDTVPYEVLSNKFINYAEMRELKIIEDLLEKTYNTGKFKNFLHVALSNFSSPFNFYQALGNFVVEKNLALVNHAPKTVIKILGNFIREKLPVIWQKSLSEYLRLDVFVSHGIRDDASMTWYSLEFNKEIMNFWRDEKKVKKYLPDYKFVTWREIKKNTPLEVFYFEEKPQVIMANYPEQKYLIIDNEDFFCANI